MWEAHGEQYALAFAAEMGWDCAKHSTPKAPQAPKSGFNWKKAATVAAGAGAAAGAAALGSRYLGRQGARTAAKGLASSGKTAAKGLGGGDTLFKQPFNPTARPTPKPKPPKSILTPSAQKVMSEPLGGPTAKPDMRTAAGYRNDVMRQTDRLLNECKADASATETDYAVGEFMKGLGKGTGLYDKPEGSMSERVGTAVGETITGKRGPRVPGPGGPRPSGNFEMDDTAGAAETDYVVAPPGQGPGNNSVMPSIPKPLGTVAYAWEESLHPRGEGGMFAVKGQGGAGKKPKPWSAGKKAGVRVGSKIGRGIGRAIGTVPRKGAEPGTSLVPGLGGPGPVQQIDATIKKAGAVGEQAQQLAGQAIDAAKAGADQVKKWAKEIATNRNVQAGLAIGASIAAVILAQKYGEHMLGGGESKLGDLTGRINDLNAMAQTKNFNYRW